MDVKTLHVFDVHCTTTKKYDGKIGPQVARRNAEDLRLLAADRGYDGNCSMTNFVRMGFVR